MFRYLLIFALSAAAWGLDTVARVGEVYITDYELSQAEKVLNWLADKDNQASQVKEQYFYLQQVNQYAERSGHAMNEADRQNAWAYIADSRGKNLDTLQQELSALDVESHIAHTILDAAILEKQLMMYRYKSQVTPTRQELAQARERHQDHQVISAQVIIAPNLSDLSFDHWPQQAPEGCKSIAYTDTQIAHLPDSYQALIKGMQQGQMSQAFEAHGKAHIVLLEKKSKLVSDLQLKDMMMQEALAEKHTEWQKELDEKFPVTLF